jgi:acetyl-CoA acetyltransferase
MKARRVAIVGVGYSTVGRDTGLSLTTLTAQASVAAMAEAGLSPSDIDGVASHCFPNQFVSATALAQTLGIPELGFFSGSVEGPAYAVAAAHGAAAVASGACEVCLTIRTVQRHGATAGERLARQTSFGGPNQFTAPYGALSAVHWAAMYKRRHMAEYGTTEEQFGAFASTQRAYAAKNSDALLREPMSIEDYLATRYVSEPLRLVDCDYPVDAGSALIFTTEERARDLRQRPVFIDSITLGTPPVTDFYLTENYSKSAPWITAKRLWSKTDYCSADVDVAGLYDGFIPIAMQWLEALGFCAEGESGPFVEAGHTGPGGVVPTNTDGGACNVGRRHGANYFIEVTRQLRGQCDDRQVPDAKVGVAANAVGGFAGAALLTIELPDERPTPSEEIYELVFRGRLP